MNIKTAKILLASALLFAGVQEAASAWQETGNALGIGIAMGLILLICGTLLRSAFRETRAPSRTTTILWRVIGVFSALSLLGQLLGLGKTPARSERVDVQHPAVHAAMRIETPTVGADL